MTSDEAKRLIKNIEADKGKRVILTDKRHPEHAELVAERSRLYATAYPGSAATSPGVP